MTRCLELSCFLGDGRDPRGPSRSAAWRGVLRFASLALCASAVGQDDEPFPRPESAEILRALEAGPQPPIVATHYFYWYREPGEHMDQLGLHFPEGQRVGYDLESWHRAEMRDASAAGIDVVLPVYWGVVDRYDKPDVRFSVRGLPPLVAALDGLLAQGAPAPKVGMFYDTSTWLASVRGDRAASTPRLDLRSESGFDVLYRTVRDFFRQVPPRHWACVEGQPLVVFYVAAFASGYDQAVFDRLRARFAEEFAGALPYLVLDASFEGVEAQGRCRWGAALNGPFVEGHVAQIGAGYDDRAVRGRTTPIREREDGRFYARSWQSVLHARPRLVLIETWNEHHEASSINATREYGRAYLEATARYVRLLKSGGTLSSVIELEYEFPRPRRDDSWGSASRGAACLAFDGVEGERGLRPVAWEDGPHRIETVDGVPTWVTQPHPFGDVHYLYVQVADVCLHDVESGTYELTVVVHDGDVGAVRVQYDGHDPEAPGRGAYTETANALRSGEGTWRELRWALPRARFANRQNGLADLRLVSPEGPLRLRSLRLAKR